MILIHHDRVTEAEKVAYGGNMAQLMNAIRSVALDRAESISSCVTLKTEHIPCFPLSPDEARVVLSSSTLL